LGGRRLAELGALRLPDSEVVAARESKSYIHELVTRRAVCLLLTMSGQSGSHENSDSRPQDGAGFGSDEPFDYRKHWPLAGSRSGRFPACTERRRDPGYFSLSTGKSLEGYAQRTSSPMPGHGPGVHSNVEEGLLEEASMICSRVLQEAMQRGSSLELLTGSG
jgi:hypothetical protein